MKIDRRKYYTGDKYGYMIFNITRCYNDMNMAERLVNSLDDGKYDSKSTKITYSLYIFKLYLSHLKEALKLLHKIYKSKDYLKYFCDEDVLKLMLDIIDEIEFKESSLNKKYLDIRHDVYHYDKINEDSINSYIKANKELIGNGLNIVTIEFNNGEYDYELASDVLTLTKYFNCNEIPKEITVLYDKVFKILKLILTNIYKIKQNEG